MLSAVSSVISGAGAELVVGGHGSMMTIVPMLLVYRCTGGVPVQVSCTGGLYRCPVHCQWSRTSPGDTSAGGTLAHVPTSGHQWSWSHPPRVTRYSVQHSAAETV